MIKTYNILCQLCTRERPLEKTIALGSFQLLRGLATHFRQTPGKTPKKLEDPQGLSKVSFPGTSLTEYIVCFDQFLRSQRNKEILENPSFAHKEFWKSTIKLLESNMLVDNLIFYSPTSSPIKFCAFLILTSPWIWAEFWPIILLGLQSKLWINTYEKILLCLQLFMN